MRPLPMLLLACATASCGPRAPRVAPTPAPEETPADFPSLPLPADPSRTFVGTTHPISFVDADPRGKWVLLCQARKDTDRDGENKVTFGHHGGSWGDSMELFFVNERGAGERLEGLVSVSPSGDHMVLRGADGHLLLRNTRTNSVKDLSFLQPDTEADPSPAMPQRMVRFDPEGRYLAILQERPQPLVVMDLESGAVRPIDPGPGRIWHFGFDDSGSYLFLRVVVKDTNGNGELDLPRLETTRIGRDLCDSPSSYSTWGTDEKGDDTELRAALVSGSRAEAVPEEVTSLGKHGLIFRDAQGALQLRSPNGTTAELVPADCDGWMWAANPTYGVVVMACGARPVLREADKLLFDERNALLDTLLPQKAKLVAFSSTGRHPLASAVTRDIAATSEEPYHVDLGRLVELPGSEGAPREYLDVETWKTIKLRPEQGVYGEHDGQAYVSDSHGPIEAVDLATGAVRAVTKAPYSQVSGRWLLAGAEMVDIERGVVVGTFPEEAVPRVLSIDASGRLLAFAKEARPGAEDYDAHHGPLEWIRFKPLPPQAPAGASR